jgi:hypothetical protein
MATAAAKLTAPVPEQAATAFEVNPKSVVLNSNGFGWRDFLIRLPEGATADCLKEPSLWRRVQQAKGISLKRHDHLYLISHDEDWAAEAIVADADSTKAILTKPRIHQFGERFDNLPQDEKYRIVWTGSGYIVQRKSDLMAMTQPAPNLPYAENDLRRLYPKAVAA